MAKANYEKPTSQVDLEARQKKDYQPPSVLTPGVDPQPSENGYIGVDAVYQTYANETERPLQADGGAESKIEANYVSSDVDTSAAATPEGERDEEEDDEDEDSNSGSGSGSTTPSTPTTPQNS